ncbi:unnamed protein product, partial [Meganyctiphanes norvegica]
MLNVKLLTYVKLFILLMFGSGFGFTRKYLGGSSCYAKDVKFFSLLRDDTFNVSFFITSENPISIQVFFVGHKNYQDNDLLILKPDGGTIQRKRDGKAVIDDDIKLNNNMTLGWNNMTIKKQDTTLVLGNIYDLTELKHSINEIAFFAKCFTDCPNRTPIWKIDQSTKVSLPLNGLSKFEITLYSDNPFNPSIVLNYLDIPLSYDEELIIRKSSNLLPSQEYHLIVEQINNMLSISTISQTIQEYRLLLKTTFKDEFKKLKIDSHESNFFLIFNPFYENWSEKDSMKIKPVLETQEEYKEVTHYTDHVIFNTGWKISTGLLTAIGVILIILLVLSIKAKGNGCISQKLKKITK